MGLVGSIGQTIKEIPTFIGGELKTACTEDKTLLSKVLLGGHEYVWSKIEDAGFNLRTVAAIVKKVVTAVFAYVLGVPLAAVGTTITTAINSGLGLKNIVWKKEAPVVEEEVAAKPTRTAKMTAWIRRRAGSLQVNRGTPAAEAEKIALEEYNETQRV